jgi:hypothetical protein
MEGRVRTFHLTSQKSLIAQVLMTSHRIPTRFAGSRGREMSGGGAMPKSTIFSVIPGKGGH